LRILLSRLSYHFFQILHCLTWTLNKLLITSAPRLALTINLLLFPLEDSLISFNLLTRYCYLCNIDNCVFSLTFYCVTSLKACLSCNPYEYNLSLSLYIFLGSILAKSLVVRSGFKYLTFFLLLGYLVDCSSWSSVLGTPQ
jgi:hypothetical protein